MLRTGCALLLAALWSLPAIADEPALELDSTLELDLTIDIETTAEVAPELELEFTTLEFTADSETSLDSEASLELVDPMPEDLLYLTFSSEVAGEGSVDDGAANDEHEEYGHECVDFIDGQCADSDCFWIRARGLDNEVVADDELIMFSLSGNVENDLSIQTFGGPVDASAQQNAATIFDASLGLVRESTAVLNVESAAAVTVQGQAGQAALFGETYSSTEASVVTDADRDYASRLATIDEMRDRALVTGDTTLLLRADQMESELKSQTRAGFILFGN